MDLKNFARNRSGRPADKTPTENEGLSEDLKKQTESLSKKSQPELMQQLMDEVQKGRTDGSFSEDALSAFAEKLSPMLNAEQKQRLETLTKQLKGQL